MSSVKIFWRTAFLLVACTTCVGILSGCSKPKRRITVAGTVVVDGELLSSGTIRFVPEAGRAVSSAILTDGSFQLASNSVSEEGGKEGVPPGKYKVAVTSSKIISDTNEQIEWFAPSHYADTLTSGLEIDLMESTDDLVIELTWEGAEPESDEVNSTPEDAAEVEAAEAEVTTAEPVVKEKE